MLIGFNWPSPSPLICTHKLALVNLLVNISCKNMRSKWTVFQQMMYFRPPELSFHLPAPYPTLKLVLLVSEKQRILAGGKDFICLFLCKTNRPLACVCVWWGRGNAYFFLLKISQKQQLLSYFGWIFWEQLVLYMVDGWQEPGYGRGISKTWNQGELQ